MLRSLVGFDWRKSEAHLLLLSKFLRPQTVGDFIQSDGWKTVLGESSSQAIKRFQEEGLMVEAELGERLSYRFKANELKELLKKRGLTASGRKEELIQRLIQADPEGAKQAVSGLVLLQCSERGREIAESYVTSEKEKRDRVGHQVLDYLRRRKFREAIQAVASYEAQQVYPRGLGIDWKNHNPANDIAVLKSMFTSKPRILGRLSDEQLELLRIAAGMMSLWGTNTAKEWIPATFETGLSFDNDTAARMFLFHAQHKTELANYRQRGVVKYIEILATHDSCDACKKVTKKQYKLAEVPELPNEYCTHTLGCRCTYIAKF